MDYIILGAEQPIIKQHLEEYWYHFVDQLFSYMNDIGVARHIKFRWIKCITLYLWMNNFPSEGALDPIELRSTWAQFTDFVEKIKSTTKRYPFDEHRSYARAFAIFWNFAISQGRLNAEPMKLERVATSFWSLLQEPIRVPLHKKYFHVPMGIKSDKEKWLHSLKYALGILGFSIFSQVRTEAIRDSELDNLREKLLYEKFLSETIERIIAEIRRITQELNGGSI